MMMRLVNSVVINAEELCLLETSIVERIVNNIRTFNRTGELEDYLKRIECDDLITPYNTLFSSNAKIIVIGASMISPDEMYGIAKELGIYRSHLELHLDYEKNKRFNFDVLRNNMNYSDVIFGPISHKCVNVRDNSSAISLITNYPDEYPKLLTATDSHGLKLTKQSFKKCLENTQYYKKNILCY